MEPITLAQHYFDLSNDSNLDGIRQLMTPATTYSSDNSGLFLGVDDIVAMQTSFHTKFESLNWQVTEVEEIKPGIVRFAFQFSGKTASGESIHSSGIEYVVIHNDRIQHIEVRHN